MPNYQGQLDGLCGPYAIVNAFEHCGLSRSEDVFRAACAAPAARRWPALLWEGTTIGDLKRMLKNCREHVRGTEKVRITFPFSRNAPKSNEEYWRRFDELFDQRPNIRCMILGLTRPSNHWIVARRDTAKRVTFIDTDPHKPFQRKNRSMLHAGSKNGNPQKWIIERSELVLFEVE